MVGAAKNLSKHPPLRGTLFTKEGIKSVVPSQSPLLKEGGTRGFGVTGVCADTRFVSAGD